ncbi:MAG: hypothetical protein ABIW50_03005 [Candidatus Limnocylindria bacterium]
MRLTNLLARISPRIAFWALAGVVLLASHDAIFLAQLGPGEALTQALRGAGHGYWAAASTVIAVVGAIVIARWLLRIARLALRAGTLRLPTAGTNRLRFMAAWSRLFVVVAIGFLLQENIEHALAHGHVPALGALVGPEYPLALPVLAAFTAFAALIVAAIGAVERDLITIIATALRRHRIRAPRALQRPGRLVAPDRMPAIASNTAGRAPPATFALTIE